MIPWWIWSLPVVGVIALMLLMLRRPTNRHGIGLAELEPLLKEFVAGGERGSVLVLEREGDPGVLQLRLRDTGDATSVVELGLPCVDWSAEGFDDLARALVDAGLSLEAEGSVSCRSVRRFLRASSSGPPPGLVAESRKMLTMAQNRLGWRDDSTYTVHLEERLLQQLGRLMRRMVRARG